MQEEAQTMATKCLCEELVSKSMPKLCWYVHSNWIYTNCWWQKFSKNNNKVHLYIYAYISLGLQQAAKKATYHRKRELLHSKPDTTSSIRERGNFTMFIGRSKSSYLSYVILPLYISSYQNIWIKDCPLKKIMKDLAGLLAMQGAIRIPGTNMEDIKMVVVLKRKNVQLTKAIAIWILSASAL